MDLSCGFCTCCAEPRILVKNIPHWSFSRNSEPQKLDDITGPVVPSGLSSEGTLTFPAAGSVTIEWVTVDIFRVCPDEIHLAKVSFLSREKPTSQTCSIKGPSGVLFGRGTPPWGWVRLPPTASQNHPPSPQSFSFTIDSSKHISVNVQETECQESSLAGRWWWCMP